MSNSTTIVKDVERVEEVHPDWASDVEAVEAAKDVIHRKALEAELNALKANFEAVTATYEAEREMYETRRVEIEKEVGTY